MQVRNLLCHVCLLIRIYAFCTHKRLHENEYSEKQVFGLTFLPLTVYGQRNIPFPSFLGHIMWKLLYVGTLRWNFFFTLSEHKGGDLITVKMKCSRKYSKAFIFPSQIEKKFAYGIKCLENVTFASKHGYNFGKQCYMVYLIKTWLGVSFDPGILSQDRAN